MRDWRQWGPALVAIAMIAVVVVLCLMASSSSGAPLRSPPVAAVLRAAR